MSSAKQPLDVRRHRGNRWVADRLAIAGPISGLAGSIFGLISALALAGLSIDWGFALIGLIVGGVVGLVLSPLMMLVTTSRDAFEGVLFVSIGTAVLTGVTAVAGLFFVGSCVSYAVLCGGWRWAKGSGAWLELPGFCVTCGYDLAGIAPEVCPECGKPVTASDPA